MPAAKKARTRGASAEENGEVDADFMRRVVKPVPRGKLAPATRRDLEKIERTLKEIPGIEGIMPVEKGIVKRLMAEEDPLESESGGGFEDDEDWDDTRFGQEESEAVAMHRDFTGDRGISGKTDLTPGQAVFLTHLRGLQQSYPELDLQVEEWADYFETYRLSIKRKSREETVQLFQGKMELGKRHAADEGAAGSPLAFK